mgnify:FL=1
MEVTKRGKVNYPGDVNVKGAVNSATATAGMLQVNNNATVSKDLTVGGKTNVSGDMNVKGAVNSAIATTGMLQVNNNATVSKDLTVGGKTVVSGDLVVKGKIIQNDNAKTEPKEEFENGVIYLGSKTKEGGWRLRVEDGELLIEKLENNEW